MPLRRLALALSATLLLAGSVQAAPALWKVSDEDSSIWLFGSVHLLPSDIEWRTGRLDKVLSKADRIYLETDIGVEAQMRLAPLTMDLGFNKDGVLLSQTIGPELTDRLRAAAAQHDLPMPMLLTMRPWMAATTISVGPLTNSGYDPALGVEMVLTEEIAPERLGFLETPEEQIGFLAGGSDEEQIAMLRATLDSLDAMETDLNAMVAAWLDGDPEALGEIFNSQMGDYDLGMVERIIDNRNYNWVEQIESMLEANEKAVLVVGAGHLVGDISVVRLLEGRGYTSERVQ